MRKNLQRFLAFAGAVLLVVGALPCWAAEGDGTPEVAYNGFIFKLKEDLPAVSLMAEEDGGLPEGIGRLSFGYYRADSLERLAELTEAGWIESIEPDYYVETMSVPDDPAYVGKKQWGLDVLGIKYAWEHGLDGTGVKIGVVDSGIYAAHEDLGTNILVDEGYQFFLNGETVERSALTPDDKGHGTFTAGIIGAQTNNGLGMAAIAPMAEIVPMKCIKNGYESMTSEVAEAIKGAVDAGCDVINVSIGSYHTDTTSKFPSFLQTSADYAQEHNAIIVASAGNGGDGNPAAAKRFVDVYPAACPNVIGVGALDQDKALASYSQINGKSVDVVAPGTGTYSTWNSAPDAYGYLNGTSFSSPMVAGIVALMKQKDPDLTVYEARLLLQSSADLSVLESATLTDRDGYGAGLVSIPGVFTAMEQGVGQIERDGDKLTVSAYYLAMAQGTDANLYAAAYTSTGRMVSITAQTKETFTLTPPASATEVRVFLVEQSTGKPLGHVIPLKIPPA